MKTDLDFELRKVITEFKEFYRLLEDKGDYRLVEKYNRLNNRWRGMGGLNEFELLADQFLSGQDKCLEEQKKLNRISGDQGCQKIVESPGFMETVHD